MKELRREEEQGKEMQVELPAWEEVDKLKELEKIEEKNTWESRDAKKGLTAANRNGWT